MGIGNSLSELHERNTNLSSAQDNLQNARQQLDSARQKLTDAEALRARILSGKGIQQPAKPAEPVAPKPAEPTPAKPPVAQEPAPAPVKPAPIAEAPGDDLVVIPNQPAPAPVAPPATPPKPAPAQPPVQQPVAPAQPPVAPPLSDDDNLYIIPGTGNSHNPVVIEGPGSQPAPVQPAPSQPAPVQPTPVQAPVAEAPKPAPVKPISSIGDGTVSKILYTVKRGDTLSSIAQSELGSWKRWPEIAKVNHEVIGNSNSHWIYPGQVLTLPPSQLKSAE